MKQEIRKLMEDAQEARGKYRMGLISREECEAIIAPYAEAFNKRSKELAKEFGGRHKPFSMTSYLR